MGVASTCNNAQDLLEKLMFRGVATRENDHEKDTRDRYLAKKGGVGNHEDDHPPKSTSFLR